MSRHRRLVLSSLLPFLPSVAQAQSFVGGDLNSIAPFSLPPSAFSSYIANPNSDRAFPITGYNLSSPASSSDATGNDIPGWSLVAHLTADVPLRESSDNNLPKDQFFQATRLSLLPPDGSYARFDKKNWLLCAVVFSGGFKHLGDGNGVNQDGTCGGYLGDACIDAIQLAGLRPGSAGNDGTASGGQPVQGQPGQGRCQDLVLPQACSGDGDGDVNSDGESDVFNGVGGGSAFEIVPVTHSETNTGAMAFFAAGSAPVKNKEDAGSIKAAEQFVWPVLLTWTHFGQGSNGSAAFAHDAVSWLSCVQPSNTTSEAVDDTGNSSDGGKDSDSGGRLGTKGFTLWAGLVGVLGVGVAAVL